MTQNLATSLSPESLIGDIARQYVMTSEHESVFGSTIYSFYRPGMAELLAIDGGPSVVRTGMEFNDALNDPEALTILVPADAAITLDLIRSGLRRITARKIVFRDAAPKGQ